MNFSAPVEAGTLKLRNRGFAYKSDFDVQKLPKIEQKLSYVGSFSNNVHWISNVFCDNDRGNRERKLKQRWVNLRLVLCVVHISALLAAAV